MSCLIVIPSYITSEKHAIALLNCVTSLRATTDAPVLIIDDGSPDSELKEKIYPSIREKLENIDTIEKYENEGFSKTVNIGLQAALHQDLDACLVNADISFVSPDWLKFMQEAEADVVGAQLLYPNLIIQHAGIYFSSFSRNFDHRFCGAPFNLPEAQKECECPVTGALQYIHKEVLEKTGLYDEEFKLGFEDVDFMLRAIEDGFRSLYDPKVKAVHHESLFRGNKSEKIKRWEKESYVRLLKKYKGKDFTGLVPTL